MGDRALHARTALEQVCARGDLERARELYADDFVDHVNALEFRGQEGIARSVALYRAHLPDLRIDVVDQISDGDRVVSRWMLQGTHRGRRVTLPGITISRFANGQIAEDWTVSDNLALLRQLGVRRARARRALRGRPAVTRLAPRATPRMWVLGGSSGGIRNANRSQRSISKPAASISRPVSRARWQPPDRRGQTVASAARWSARSDASRGEATCSKNRSSPPGRTTRCSSASAASTSPTEHSTSEATAASKVAVGERQLLGERVDDADRDRRVPGGRVRRARADAVRARPRPRSSTAAG